MSENIIMSTSISKLTTALVAAKKEFSPILRDRNNPFFKSKYADLASALEATEPALEKNGLAVSQFPVNELDRIGVLTLVLHESGEFIGREFTLPVAKQDAQTGTAAVTYARRTAYMAALGVAAEDDDGNRAAGNADIKADTKATAAPVKAEKATAKAEAKADKTSIDASEKTRASTKAAVPKAEIPSELPGAATPAGEAKATPVANPATLNPVEDDAVPNETQLQGVRKQFAALTKTLTEAGLEASKGKPVGRKVTLYLLHRTGTKDPDKVTFGQWKKFFDECETYRDSVGGFEALAKVVEATSGGK